MLFRNSIVRLAPSLLCSAAIVGCSAGAEDPSAGIARQAILGGTVVVDASSPILYMSGPQGSCTATLIAPNLVVTARHCVAETPEGAFSCTASGDLATTGTSAGQIGADDPPAALTFYTNARILNGTLFVGPPDAVGMMTISTNTTTSCRDDLAFVVLEQPVTGITPAALRFDDTTHLGESVSAWGYGLTAEAGDPTVLRVRDTAVIEGVGYDTPTSGSQLAPLRAVRVGPDDITCNGDSGGPITSNATGAILAIASLGALTSSMMPACAPGGGADTTGPRLGAYEPLALLAFSTAGATPTLEPGSSPINFPPDGGAEAGDDGDTPDASPSVDGGTGVTPKSLPPDLLPTYRAAGGSCSAAPGRGATDPLWFGATALALVAMARRRRVAARRGG